MLDIIIDLKNEENFAILHEIRLCTLQNPLSRSSIWRPCRNVQTKNICQHIVITLTCPTFGHANAIFSVFIERISTV